MGPTRSKIKKTRKSIIMKPTKRESKFYTYAALLGICIACLPWLVVASQVDEGAVVRASDHKVDIDEDLEAAESQNLSVVQRPPSQRVQPQRVQPQRVQPQRTQSQAVPMAVPTSPIPVAVPPPPGVLTAVAAPPAGFTIPKTDLASAPSYAPRYAVPPANPWRESFPFEVQQFRRRATDDDGQVAEDDYQPQESKGKKHSPGVLKRVRNSIRNTGKAIVGAPSYILKRYRATWKKYVGGGGGGKKKKEKGGWKGWSSGSDKNDGGWGWEESEPTGGYYEEPSQYTSDKGWKGGKGYSDGYDSRERRDRDREPSSYRDYRDRDSKRDYDSVPASRSPPKYRSDRERDRPKTSSNYREETHYDDYDGRRTTAYYGSTSRKSPPKRPSGSTSRYDEDY